MDLTNLSAKEFIRGDRGGNRIGLILISAMIDRKDLQNFDSRSCFRYLQLDKNPQPSIVMFREIWFIHCSFGWGVIPAIYTFLEPMWMKNKTKYVINPIGVITSTVKKSHAAKIAWWFFMNLDLPVYAKPCAGQKEYDPGHRFLRASAILSSDYRHLTFQIWPKRFSKKLAPCRAKILLLV